LRRSLRNSLHNSLHNSWGRSRAEAARVPKIAGAARIAAMATVTMALGVTMTEIIKEQN
jgi:hypothetical protein